MNNLHTLDAKYLPWECRKPIKRVGEKLFNQFTMSDTTNGAGGEQKPVQKKTMMIIICLFAGALGIHRYMMGYKNWWLQLLLTVLCGVGIFWVWYDLFMILTGKMKMADGRELEA